MADIVNKLFTGPIGVGFWRQEYAIPKGMVHKDERTHSAQQGASPLPTHIRSLLRPSAAKFSEILFHLSPVTRCGIVRNG